MYNRDEGGCMKKTFGFKHVDVYYHQYYLNGQWEKPVLSTKSTLDIEMSATSIHYGQQAFEGMKAYQTKDGHIQLFRPFENAKRFRQSCRFMMMPELSDEHFIKAVKDTVLANVEHMPPYDYHQALYIRPFMIGVGHNIGLRPSPSYYFGVLVIPVGEYLESEKAYPFLISDRDRVAPKGSGPYKVGGNYGAVMRVQYEAKQQGYQDILFLDPLTHTKIDEGAGSNFFAIKGNTYVTPKSDSILKSITNDSIKSIAKDLGMNVIESDILLDELHHYDEAGACGTAAIVSPIGSLTYQDHKVTFGETIGSKTKILRETLLAIQFGDVKDTRDWIYVIK